MDVKGYVEPKGFFLYVENLAVEEEILHGWFVSSVIFISRNSEYKIAWKFGVNASLSC